MRSVDQVLADSDVPLVDQDSGLVDGLGLEALLVDSSLEPLVQEFVDGQTQDVIELELFIAEEAISVHSVEEGSAFEKSSGILFLESEELTSGLSEVGEEQMDSPDLTLVLETVLTDELQFVVDSFLFERSSGSMEGGRIYVRTYLQFL